MLSINSGPNSLSMFFFLDLVMNSPILEDQMNVLLGVIQSFSRVQHIAVACIEHGFDVSSYGNGETNRSLLEQAVAEAIVSTGMTYQSKILEHGIIGKMVEAEAAKMAKAAKKGPPTLTVIK